MSAIPLLHPIVWQGPMIPILPRNMVEYLDAPVPSLIGTYLVDVAKKAELADHCLIMDCDRRTVTAPKLRRLPNRSKLYPFYTYWNSLPLLKNPLQSSFHSLVSLTLTLWSTLSLIVTLHLL